MAKDKSKGKKKEKLSADEKAELEALRADKAAREAQEKDARLQEELEELRREKRAYEEASAQDAQIAEAKEKGRKLMEPDDDLAMPLGQKIVIVSLIVLVIVILAMHFFGNA